MLLLSEKFPTPSAILNSEGVFLMNDKQIRKILIAYLQAQGKEIRIYQEKNIGSSICDLMAVTDCLTGYEIKSGQDDYRHLSRQVTAYSLFFDRCYIVVGVEHRRSVPEHVPANWGILVVEETGITVERPAKPGWPSRRSQLEVLWKLELKNLLTKLHMPPFTYKDKSYIISRILETAQDSELHEHIVYELMHRDYSLFNATDYTLYFSENFLDNSFPLHTYTELIAGQSFDSLSEQTAEVVDSLSEQNLDEITLDQWIDLYRQAKELQRSKESIYQSAPAQVRERAPHAIPYTDIEVSPGVPWVSKGIISAFIHFLRTGKEMRYPHKMVNYEPITGNWHILEKRDMRRVYSSPTDPVRVEETYGESPAFNALHIFEAMLNLREIKLRDAGGRYDERRTLAALKKQDDILALFKDWIWQDEDRRWEVEEAYNSLFAGFTPKSYDGSRLEFPEMDPGFQLYPYQRDAIQHILNEKNTLLAFDVGAGKTFIMICAAMKLRQEGASRKNLFVVPNNIVGQWELMFRRIYPMAQVMTVDPSSFKPQMRQKVLAQIRDGDYDGIIMAYSCFEKIPLSSKTILDQAEAKLREIEAALENVKYEAGSSTALNRERENIKRLAGEMIKGMSASAKDITFDQLEINTLFVDEAHNFKNVPIRTRMRNIAGVNTIGSKKCLEMLHKVRAVQEANSGRGCVFATGTPLCNSLVDAYTMQIYLQYDVMKAHHLDVFDNWVKSFAKPERVCEIDVDTSKFRFVTRFARFFNLPELSKMFADIAIFHAMDGEQGLPGLRGYTDVKLLRSKELRSYMQALCERTEHIRSGDVERSKDNMLKVSTDGRKATLDLRLVGQRQPDGKGSKVFSCVENVYDIYNRFSGCSQIIFCDYSTPKKKEFNVYQELKRLLLARGVPEREIAFIHSYHSEARKAALYEQMNQGKVRVLIGSTFKLGIGANVQRCLRAIHHLDVPWRPADMVQREGRILRQGNENRQVDIFRYITQGSFDAYSWQILETKQRFISQFLTGTTYQRTASDLEENVLTYAQVKALAIANQKMKLLAEKENELRRFRLLSDHFAEAKENGKAACARLEEEISMLDKRRDVTEKLAVTLQSVSAEAYQSLYRVWKGILTEDVLTGKAPLPKEAQTICGFQVSILPCQEKAGPRLVFTQNGESYPLELGEKAAGNARRVVNFLKHFGKQLVGMKQTTGILAEKLASSHRALRQENPYLTEIRKVETDVKKLRAEVDKSV